ncbi:MAG: TonB-dependent receptor domain-containing protein, partial [Bryobacteraceae bacterium]
PAFSLILCTAIAAPAQTPKPDAGDSRDTRVEKLYQSITIRATPLEPIFELRNAETFRRTLFSRDDQVLHLLDLGINAGQHEGGGKSLEIRRYGFNLDHGGVNGGLKIMIDNIQQNQGTQGHGQGYLGALKSLTPELVEEVDIINGPFNAEYGDFSGLGVVHIRLRESLPEKYTLRGQVGSFDSRRAFLGWSPLWKDTEAVFGYEVSDADGPFLKPLGYRRDNLTGNMTRTLRASRSAGLRFNLGRNDFNSSGQLPLDEVAAGRLDRFGFLDPGDGGQARAGSASLFLRRENSDGSVWKVDGFLARSLFDLYSNFTFFLNDPAHGDGIQQHDSRLQQGANIQYLRPQRAGPVVGTLATGANFHANQVNVGLYPRVNRTPLGVTTRAQAAITNAAGYLQESLSLLGGRLQLGGGIRYDVFRFDLDDRVDPVSSRAAAAGRWQPKASFAWKPASRVPVTAYANYGRGISSLDARGITASERGAHLATTDFYQAGLSHAGRRTSLVAGMFWISRSDEIVYIPDDGSLEFNGP